MGDNLLRDRTVSQLHKMGGEAGLVLQQLCNITLL